MCGIAFLYEENPEQPAIRMHNCINKLIHRGPDEGNIYSLGNAHLGHRRLSIIDVAESHQPFIDPDGRYGLVYNGEIYNYKELREQLKSKWHFKTQGDSEVLFAGIILHGIKFLQKIEGMWAFAFWDKKKQQLILCRDRIGKKPLYFLHKNNDLYAASELPALKALCRNNWQEDLDSTADYFRYGYYLPGTTAYKDIKEVLPGHYIIWQPNKALLEQRYWQLQLDRYSFNKKTALQELKENLISSVEKRMVADVEVGAFLSGGIDSSLIVGIMTKELGIKPKTFTIGFNESSFDESQYAKQIADKYDTLHFEKKISTFNIEQLVSLILNNVGQPFIDSSLLPTAMVSELAGEHVKVALSGDGADELFSGYQRYQAISLLRWYSRLPKQLRTNINKLIRYFPEPTSHHSRSLLKKAHLFLDIVSRNEATTPYIAPLLYSRDNFNLLVPEICHRGHNAPGIPETTYSESFQATMTSDLLIYLPQDILQKVDRASMAYSLETRAPFLDKKVVELAFALPPSWHRKNFQGKRMLRQCFPELLPASIWKRRKQGFSVPVHHWFNGHLGNDLLDLLNEIDTPLNHAFIKNMLSQHKNHIKDNSVYLWQCYTYLKWRKESMSDNN